MRRREFITSLFSGAAVGAPSSVQRGAPERMYSKQELNEVRASLAAQCERLSLDLQNTNQKLSEAREHCSIYCCGLRDMSNQVADILMLADRMRKNTSCKLSDEIRDDLDLITLDGKRFRAVLRYMFDRLRQDRASADVTA